MIQGFGRRKKGIGAWGGGGGMRHNGCIMHFCVIWMEKNETISKKVKVRSSW